MLDNLTLMTLIFNAYICLLYCADRIYEDMVSEEEDRYLYVFVYVVIPFVVMEGMLNIYKHSVSNLVTR